MLPLAEVVPARRESEELCSITARGILTANKNA